MKLQWKPGRKLQRALIVLLVCAAAAVLARVVWHQLRPKSPTDMFYQALQTNLQQTAVTCTIKTQDNSSTSQQALSLDLGSAANIRAVTTLTQNGAQVTTEEIANKSAVYVRYTSLGMTGRPAAGTATAGSRPDFSKALNVWSKSPASEQGTSELGTSEPGTKQQGTSLFGRTALGNCIVPLAHLSDDQVRPLMLELRKGTVFQTSFSDVRQSTLNSSPVRVYAVTVQPRPYIDFMKRVGQAYRLHDLDAVNSEDFAKRQSEHLNFSVDAKTDRLVRIEYATKHQTIDFSDYGAVPRLAIPKTTVTPQELQKRLASQ